MKNFARWKLSSWCVRTLQSGQADRDGEKTCAVLYVCLTPTLSGLSPKKHIQPRMPLVNQHFFFLPAGNKVWVVPLDFLFLFFLSGRDKWKYRAIFLLSKLAYYLYMRTSLPYKSHTQGPYIRLILSILIRKTCTELPITEKSRQSVRTKQGCDVRSVFWGFSPKQISVLNCLFFQSKAAVKLPCIGRGFVVKNEKKRKKRCLYKWWRVGVSC